MPNNIPKYLNITSDVNLVRDTHSMGIVNVNESAFQAYQTKKKVALQKMADERRKDMELNTLRTEVAEMKQLLNQLLEKKNADSAR